MVVSNNRTDEEQENRAYSEFYEHFVIKEEKELLSCYQIRRAALFAMNFLGM
jgi:hypothetical protein